MNAVRTVCFGVTGPQGVWRIEITETLAGRNLQLEPVRAPLRPGTSQVDWHLHAKPGDKTRLRVLLVPPGANVGISGILNYRLPLALGLVEQERSTEFPVMRVRLSRGELYLPFEQIDWGTGEYASATDCAQLVPNGSKTEFDLGNGAAAAPHISLAALWPTTRTVQKWQGPLSNHTHIGQALLRKVITALRILPDGLYVQGRMPAAFFPPQTSAAPGAELKTELVLAVKYDPKSKHPDTWRLTSRDFGKDRSGAPLYTSAQYVRDNLRAVCEFRLSEKNQRLRSFVASGLAEQNSDCVVTLTRTKWPVLQIDAKALGAQFTLGGGNGPDAVFVPQRLSASMQLDFHEQAQPVTEHSLFRDWQRATLVFGTPLSESDSTQSLTKPQVQLVIDRQANSVHCEFQKDRLRALALPTTPPPSAKEAANEPESAWLCLDRGWLRIDGLLAAGRVVLDENIYRPGAMTGVLDLSQLATDLTPSAKAAEAGMARLELELLATSSLEIGFDFVGQTAPRLYLRMNEAMAVLRTPPWWLRQHPDAQRPQLPPSLASCLRGLLAQTSTANPVGLDWSQCFGSAVFVSAKVTRITSADKSSERPAAPPSETSPPSAAAPLPLEVEVELEVKVRLALSSHPAGSGPSPDGSSGLGWKPLIERTNAMLWYGPPGYPLAQSFPLSSALHQDQWCDDLRGLLPYRLKDKQDFPALDFKRALPSLGPSEPRPRAGALVPIESPWQLDVPKDVQFYYLPTLPGIELALKEEAERSGQGFWYRHAVPALDEAYTEAREQRADQTPPATTAPSLVRVAAAEAFVVSLGPGKAVGWLPKTQTNPQGALPMQIAEVQLSGPAPSFSMEFAALPGREPIRFSFSRTQPMFPDHYLRATPQGPLDAPLPGLQVALETAESTTNRKHALRRHGQPLLAVKSAAGLLTLDGEGLLQAEPDSGLSYYRHDAEKDRPLRRRMTRSVPLLSGPAGSAVQLFVLELIGVNLSASPPHADGSKEEWKQDAYQQRIALHDGQGGWPSLLGFPLYPRSLERLSWLPDGTVQLELRAVWCPFQPHQPEDYSNAGGELTLSFQGSDTGPLTLSRIAGNVDWRLSSQRGRGPQIVALQGTILEAETGDASLAAVEFALSALTVDLDVGSGELQLDLLTLDLRESLLQPRARIIGGQLVFPARIERAQGSLRATLSAIDPISAAAAIAPSLSADLKWTVCFADPNLVAELLHPHPSKWSLNILHRGVVLFQMDLAATAIADRQLILTPPTNNSSPAQLPAGSWFARAAHDLGFVYVEFETSAELKTLSAELRMLLREPEAVAAAPVPDTVALPETRLVAHLRIEVDAASPKAPAVFLSGKLCVRNQIQFRTSSDTKNAASHIATVFLDQAPVPLSVVFLGTLEADRDCLLGAVVEHRLTLAGQTFCFQSPQLVRVTTAQRYGQTYLDHVVGGASVALDLGAAFFVKVPVQPGRTPPATVLVDDIGCGNHVALSLKARPCMVVAPGEGHVMRLPMVACESPLDITILLGKPSLELGTEALHYPSIAFLSGGAIVAPARTEAEERSTAFVKHSPRGHLISSSALLQLLLPEKAESRSDLEYLRLAFATATGKPTVKLPSPPRALVDLEFLRVGQLGEESAPPVIAGPAGEFRLSVALLMPQHIRSGAETITALELPFDVIDTRKMASKREVPAEAAVDVQLVYLSEGQLVRLEHASLVLSGREHGVGSEVAVRWARDLLKERRRSGPALVLLDYLTQPGDLLRLLQLAEAQKRDMPRPRPWAGSYGPDQPEQDPRLWLPDGKTSAPRADAALRGMTFAAWPIPVAMTEKTPAATLLRFAKTTGASPMQLRPAQAVPTAMSPAAMQTAYRQFLLRKWDEVEFQEQALARFPRVSHRAVLNRPQPPLLDDQPQGEITPASDAMREPRYSVAPPVIDLVAWSARPGEMMRTYLGMAGVLPGRSDGANGQSGAVGEGPMMRVGLRRPRALASPLEHAELLQLRPSQRCHGQRFTLTDFVLSQALGQSVVPSDTVTAVMTTRDAFYPASYLSSANEADRGPGLYFEPVIAQASAYPTLALIAPPGFTPNPDNARTWVLLSTQPQPNLAVLGENPTAGAWVAAADSQLHTLCLDVPRLEDWPDVPAASGKAELKLLSLSLGRELQSLTAKAKEQGLRITTLYLLVGKVELMDGKYVLLWPAARLKIAILKEANAIVTPKLALTLMAGGEAQLADLSLVGYRRIGPEDFTPLSPVQIQSEVVKRVEWVRRAEVRLLARANANRVTYDAALFGPSGESIPCKTLLAGDSAPTDTFPL